MYKDGGIVEKILSYFEYRRNKRFLKDVKKFIGKRHLCRSTWEFDHDGRRYHMKIEEVV